MPRICPAIGTDAALDLVLDRLECLVAAHVGAENAFACPDVQAFLRDPAVARLIMRPRWARRYSGHGGRDDEN